MNTLSREKAIRLALYDAHIFYEMRPRPEKLDMMVDLLEGYSPEQVRGAIKQWMLLPPERGHKPRPPMPNELIDLISPRLSFDEQAAELAGLLQGAISRFGNPHWQRAKDALPAIAWDVMKANYGCWEQFCATSDEKKLESRRAQLRELFVAALRRRGRGDVAPQSKSLPAKGASQMQLTSIGDIARSVALAAPAV